MNHEYKEPQKEERRSRTLNKISITLFYILTWQQKLGYYRSMQLDKQDYP